MQGASARRSMNAYYNPQMNEIVVPAGYLQPPGFDPKGLDAINYGAVGVSISHEISHGVDDEGAQFAADGTLQNWRTDADHKNFEAHTACTTKQYDKVCSCRANWSPERRSVILAASILRTAPICARAK